MTISNNQLVFYFNHVNIGNSQNPLLQQSNINSNSNSNSNRNAVTNSDSNINGNSYSDSNCDKTSDDDINSNSNSDSNCNSNSDRISEKKRQVLREPAVYDITIKMINSEHAKAGNEIAV